MFSVRWGGVSDRLLRLKGSVLAVVRDTFITSVDTKLFGKIQLEMNLDI